MCLEKKGTFEPCKVGYKVVSKREGKLYSSCRGEQSKPLRRGVWLNEKDYRYPSSARKTIEGSYFNYPFGFHVFHSREDANSFRLRREEIVKVAVKEPLVTGTQEGWQITVAKQIKILSVV